jgi:hypothetical protein
LSLAFISRGSNRLRRMTVGPNARTEPSMARVGWTVQSAFYGRESHATRESRPSLCRAAAQSNPGLEVLRRDYGEAPARTGTGSGAAGWTGLPQSVGAQTSRPRLPLGGRWKRGGRPNSTLRPQTTNRRYDVLAQDTSSNLCPRVLSHRSQKAMNAAASANAITHQNQWMPRGTGLLPPNSRLTKSW